VSSSSLALAPLVTLLSLQACDPRSDDSAQPVGDAILGTVTVKGHPLGGVTVSAGQAQSASSLDDGSFQLPPSDQSGAAVVPSLLEHSFDPPQIEIEPGQDAGPLEFAIASAPFPSARDAFEGDDSRATARPLEPGAALQHGTGWPSGDADWFALELQGGTQYEVFTTHICPTCDTELSIYDSDGQTLLAEGDDFIEWDARALVQPATSGTYYARVFPFAERHGVLEYLIGARVYQDQDGDGFGSFHDCDDGDQQINPAASEQPGSGVDSDCDGYLVPALDEADSFEPDSQQAPRSLEPAGVSVGEVIHAGPTIEEAAGTLHEAADVDWFSIVVPAYAYYEGLFLTKSDGPSLAFEVLDAATMQPVEVENGWFGIHNDSADEASYLVSLSRSETAGGLWYFLWLDDYGTDADGDGYFSKDFDDEWDCDDSDPSVQHCG